MITFHPFHLEVSIPAAVALLAFASKDATRPQLSAIGVEGGRVCATDGHTAVSFDAQTADGAQTATWSVDGRVWSRAFVDTAVKVAKAEKRATVVLQYGLMLPADVKFPPLERVMPRDGIEGTDHAIGFNPGYMARLQAVAKACGCEGVKLTSVRGSLDPLGFRATGTEGQAARVAIMPMRI